MKNYTTQLSFPIVIAAIFLFISCTNNTQNHKSYSTSVSTNNEKTLADKDMDFLYAAYHIAHFQSQLANEAVYRSTATESSAVAREVLNASQQIKDDLFIIAEQYHLNLPADMNRTQKNEWKDLVKQKGWEFDKKFSKIVEDIQANNDSLYSGAIKVLEDDSLKKLATKALAMHKGYENSIAAQQEKIIAKTSVPVQPEEQLVTKNKK